MRIMKINMKNALYCIGFLVAGMVLSVLILKCVFLRSTDAALRFFDVASSVSQEQYDVLQKPKTAGQVVADTVQESSEAETLTTQPSVSADMPTDTYVTPEDVFEMEEEYLAAFAPLKTSGVIVEDDFSHAGATHYVGNAVIRNATETKNPDFAALLQQGPVLENADTDEPLVLVFHTHTSETYLLSDNGVFWEDYSTHTLQSEQNMIRIGRVLTERLRENGIGVIHDTRVYDTDYTTAYASSRQGIQQILEQYPSVEIVLDVHRDAFYYSDDSRGKPVCEINGKKAAQIMIISGAQEGDIVDFPNWETNLRFALALQDTAGTLYPGLMRPLFFCQRKYNMDVGKNSLLLEIGSDANSLDEALYAADLCAGVIAKVVENCK